MKFVIVLALATLVALASGKDICTGCPETMNISEANEILKTTFTKLSTLDGPYYTFSKINSATKQVVAGVIYSINVDLIDADKNVEACDIVIVEQSWLGSTVVSFNCPNKKEIVKTYQAKN